MKEIGEALSLIFEKIAGFFDIFDLSFFVSGAVALSAIVYAMSQAYIGLPNLEGWLGILGVVLGCYISGLVCFAGGRWLRMDVIWRGTSNVVDRIFPSILEAHGIHMHAVIAGYLARPGDLRGIWRLYVRFWAELRRSKESSATLAFLNRYWVMAATYDGVAFALLLWFLAFAFQVFESILLGEVPSVLVLAIVALLPVFAIACFREANRYVEYQVEELAAAIAAQYR